MPNISTVFERDTLVRPKVAALSVNDGWLTTIGQDAFKDENIQLIDVSNNTIDSVNVNAFRGLEVGYCFTYILNSMIYYYVYLLFIKKYYHKK